MDILPIILTVAACIGGLILLWIVGYLVALAVVVNKAKKHLFL